MSGEQITSRDEIAAAARRCQEAGEPCPYPPGTDAHDEWLRMCVGMDGGAGAKKGGQLARLAAQFCRQPEFQAFCCTEDEAQARQFVLATCRIESRAQLDHDAGAARLFHELVRRPFVEWQGRR